MSVKGVTEIKTSDECGTFRRTTSYAPILGKKTAFASGNALYQPLPADRKHPQFPIFALLQAASPEAASTNAMLGNATPSLGLAGASRSGACNKAAPHLPNVSLPPSSVGWAVFGRGGIGVV